MAALILETQRLKLRLPEPSDVDEILAYYARNRAHFAPTDPPHPALFFEKSSWTERIASMAREFAADQSVRLFAFDQEANRLVGTLSFTQIFRGPFQACYLGYGLDRLKQGQGLMTEALTSAIPYMFRERKLHRIMANHLPENERSARLLKRLGFRCEGVARDYLWIGGTWRDHVLNSLVNPGWKPEWGSS